MRPPRAHTTSNTMLVQRAGGTVAKGRQNPIPLYGTVTDCWREHLASCGGAAHLRGVRGADEPRQLVAPLLRATQRVERRVDDALQRLRQLRAQPFDGSRWRPCEHRVGWGYVALANVSIKSEAPALRENDLLMMRFESSSDCSGDYGKARDTAACVP